MRGIGFPVIRTGFPITGGSAVAVAPPVISGTVTIGGTLTITGTGPFTLYRNGVSAGAVTSGYTYVAADMVDAITVSNAGGTSNTLSYDPTTAMSLVAEYDFAQGVTTSGGLVSALTDQSGRGNNLAWDGAGKGPTYNATDATFGNQPTATGDGVDDRLGRAVMSLGGTWIPGAMIIVCKLVTNTNGRIPQAYSTTARHIENTAGRVQGIIAGITQTTATDFTAATHCLITTDDGTNARRYLDGALTSGPTAASTTTADGGAFGLFGYSTASFWSNVTIAYAALTLTNVTAAQAADFAAYSHNRWATP